MILTRPICCTSNAFSFLLRRLLFDFLYLLSSDESYCLNDEDDKLGYDSGSSFTHFFLDKSIVSVSVLGSDVFVPTGVYSKGGQLIKMFWRSNS